MVDGKLSDGNERGGIVGTDNGGNPNDRIIFKIFEFKEYYFSILPGDVYDGVAGIPAATGGTAVNVELGRVLTRLIR